MRRVSMLFAAAIISLTACGGSSDSSTGVNGLLGTFSANVGGVAWTASVPLSLITNGGVTITGSNSANTITVTLSFLATGPGTVSLNFSGGNGSLGTVNKTGGQAYSTVHTGGIGSVTVTTLTAHHAVGTFSFDAIGSGPTDILHVTNGSFDITM